MSELLVASGQSGLTDCSASAEALVAIITSGEVKCAVKNIAPDTLETIVTGVFLTVRSHLKHISSSFARAANTQPT